MVVLFFTLSSLLIAMQPRHVMPDEPEPDDVSSDVAAASSGNPVTTYNKVAVYCFLCICVKRSLELINGAEYDENSAEIGALNAIHEVLMDVYSLFERDGISAGSLQVMKEMHSALHEYDPSFNASDFMTVAPESDFTMTAPEPEIESLLPPDPPDDFSAEDMAPPYEARSPEHMAMWLIHRITQKLNYHMESGNPKAAQNNVERRQIMVDICRFCNERPEQRAEVWKMMQTLDEMSSDEEGDE
eukprot:s3690_g12.t1